MSRLDSAIRRLLAQRACLDQAAIDIEDMSGPVLELGLGNGRTFDHLRNLFPERDIFVFDRHIAAHPDCIPDDEHMILGDFAQTLPGALDRIGARAAFAHCDIGSGDADESAARAAMIWPLLATLLAPGGFVLCDQNLAAAGWTDVALPSGVAPGRYYMYRT